MKGRPRTKGKDAVGSKIAEMRREGYRGDVAAAAAYSMKRKGELGAHGEYERKTDRPRGPRGKQRKSTAHP